MGKKINKGELITALITSPSIKKAAEECGITVRTAHTYLSDPDFRAKLQKAQDELTRAGINRVLGSVGIAMNVLDSIMQDEKAAPGPRVSAAKAVLDIAMKAYDLEKVQRRLDALERKAGFND